MQGLSTALVAVIGVLAMMLAGHFSLARGVPGRIWLVGFCLAFALQSGLLVLHLLSPGVLPPAVRAVIGASIPPLIYLFFARGTGLPATPLQWRDALNAAPVLALLLLALKRDAGWWIDAVMVITEAGYALALLSLNRASGPVGPIRRRALLITAGFLFVVAVLDVVIAFELADGRLLDGSLALRTAVLLLLALLVAWFVWAWRDPEWFRHLAGSVLDVTRTAPPETPIDCSADPQAEALCRRLDAHLREHRAYAEFGLSLASTAKRLSVSARQLSAAVNHIHGRGFRTLLNDYKVEAAARLLLDPAMAQRPITEIMFDAGFQTKSNFNKEFTQRKGVPPSEFRARHGCSEGDDHQDGGAGHQR